MGRAGARSSIPLFIGRTRFTPLRSVPLYWARWGTNAFVYLPYRSLKALSTYLLPFIPFGSIGWTFTSIIFALEHGSAKAIWDNAFALLHRPFLVRRTNTTAPIWVPNCAPMTGFHTASPSLGIPLQISLALTSWILRIVHENHAHRTWPQTLAVFPDFTNRAFI